MDFLKTMLLYMALTTAVSVQGAEPPSAVTPVPTEIVAEVTVTPAPEATATPEPTATPTITPVPEPTITPNTAYTLLRKGSKGEEVRKLQTRLKELGYLTGNIDGSYGNATRSAVLRFQKANHLSADGEAGKATLTILYESPYVVKADGTILSADAEAEETAAVESVELTAPEVVTPSPEPLSLEIMPVASVVYNGSGEPLSFLRSVDGVTMLDTPALYDVSNGTVAVNLSDLADAIEQWVVSPIASGWIMSAEGYTVEILVDGGQFTCTVDGEDFPCSDGDFFIEGNTPVIRAELLGELLHGTSVWEPEENTLLLLFQGKEVDQATD